MLSERPSFMMDAWQVALFSQPTAHMKKIRITGRPLNGFRAILAEHREAGMEILTRNARSMPIDLRRDLNLEPENFAVCGFMGHRALTNQGDLGESHLSLHEKDGAS